MNAVQKKFLNLILLGAVGALAGWLLFYQLGRTDDKATEEKLAERVLPAGPVVRLALTTPKGSFELERQGESWHIVAPIETEAEQSTIDGLVKHLLSLEQIRKVGKKNAEGELVPPAELWLFALEPARFTVKLTRDTGDVIVLHVGKKNAFDGSIYVKLGSSAEVLQVDGALEYQVDKSLYQLRDKRLLAFEEDEVSRLVVHPADGATYAIGRSGEEFTILEPSELPADRAQVIGIISALANVRAKEFVSEKATAADLEEYGLDRPTVRIEVRIGEQTQEILLARQQVGRDAAYYAMRAGEHPILQLSSDWAFKKINVELDALQDKHVLRFDRDAVRTLTLTRGDATLAFERTRNAEDTRDQWRMLRPEPGDVDDAALAGILYRLWSMKAKTVIKEAASAEDLESAGLAEPEILVELNAADDASLGIMRFTTDLKGERLATSGSRIGLIDGSAVSDLSFEAADYRVVEPSESATP